MQSILKVADALVTNQIVFETETEKNVSILSVSYGFIRLNRPRVRTSPVEPSTRLVALAHLSRNNC